MTVMIALPVPAVGGDGRRRRPAGPHGDVRQEADAVARHDDAVAQVHVLLPVLRATVEELDHHVQARHRVAADFRRAQESLRER